MRIYVFKSETTDRLRAFAGDPDMNKLPRQHGPWTVTGTITLDNAPLHPLARCDRESNKRGRLSTLSPTREEVSTDLTKFLSGNALAALAAHAACHHV
jgi:hypothetical protein